jgi:hypothetical protein
MIKSILTILCISIVIAVHAQSDCIKDCSLDAVYEKREIKHRIFNGEDTTGLHVSVTQLVVSPSRKEVVKRRKLDCLSANPVECLVEVVETIPAVTMKLYTLPENTTSTQYDIRMETIEVMVSPSRTVTEPIVCPKNRSVSLIKKIQNALIGQGYPIAETGILDEATQLSIDAFQRDKGLAHGDLTLAVVAALGIK